MDVRVSGFNLTESRRSLADCSARRRLHEVIERDVMIECDLRAGTKADGYVRLSDRGKATRDGVGEPGRHESIGHVRRSTFDEMETVIAHGSTSSLRFVACRIKPPDIYLFLGSASFRALGRGRCIPNGAFGGEGGRAARARFAFPTAVAPSLILQEDVQKAHNERAYLICLARASPRAAVRN
jgi:hypothetical protein